MVWKPHVTVAAIIEREHQFLLVEEETEKGIAYFLATISLRVNQ
jgi:hypothetical protein